MNGQTPCGNCPQSGTRMCLCSANVLCFLLFLFAAALGIILGVIFALDLFASLAAIIVGAVILAILIVSLLIYRACNRCRFGC